ncbi:heavy metal-associated domain-containing protein [Clostridium sp.]|uniref:heavy-metal-associated domain-containing protein n=1 Tax=Clostridium sp. TaxID=1506 RepID=UPI002FCC3124
MKKTIVIDGMSCMNCVKHVKEALAELNGVGDVVVDLTSNTAVINTDFEIANNDIIKALDEFGYEVVEIK